MEIPKRLLPQPSLHLMKMPVTSLSYIKQTPYLLITGVLIVLLAITEDDMKLLDKKNGDTLFFKRK